MLVKQFFNRLESCSLDYALGAGWLAVHVVAWFLIPKGNLYCSILFCICKESGRRRQTWNHFYVYVRWKEPWAHGGNPYKNKEMPHKGLQLICGPHWEIWIFCMLLSWFQNEHGESIKSDQVSKPMVYVVIAWIFCMSLNIFLLQSEKLFW